MYGRLGGMMPTAGGDFDYLRRAFGDRAAFSFAWYNFFVGKSGSQAIIATMSGQHTHTLFCRAAAAQPCMAMSAHGVYVCMCECSFGRYLSAVLQMDASFVTAGLGESGSGGGVGGGGAESPLAKAAAISLILASTAVNCAGVKQSAVVSVLLTSIKVPASEPCPALPCPLLSTHLALP